MRLKLNFIDLATNLYNMITANIPRARIYTLLATFADNTDLLSTDDNTNKIVNQFQ